MIFKLFIKKLVLTTFPEMFLTLSTFKLPKMFNLTPNSGHTECLFIF